MKVYILNQLLKNIRAYKADQNVTHGDLYGLQNSDTIYIFSCCLTYHHLQHDPTLILPASFLKLGSLIFSTKEQPVPSLTDANVALVSTGSLILYVLDTSGTTVSQEFCPFESKDIPNAFAIAKISYSLPILCGNKTADVKSFIGACKDELFSSSCHFKLRNGDVIVNSEGCVPREELGKAIGSFSSCCLAEGGSPVQGVSFEVFFNRSSVTAAASAPLLQIDSNKFRIIKSRLYGEVGVYLHRTQAFDGLTRCFGKAITNQLQLAEYWILKQLQDSSMLSPLRTYLMDPLDVGYMIMPIYPANIGEESLSDYRRQIHQTFLFPLNRPMVRKIFATQSSEITDVLINPHLKVNRSTVKGGNETLVQGLYGYHHYMQDRINDNKWGCAYRSLQTLISWFRLQGYTDKPIPTHSQIQQILVDIHDKPSSFVGTHQWIGSTEVGFVLEMYLNVSSRFIAVNSGADIADHGRDLATHFETIGTPIMIGGGVLAHTIIGVDWNCSTGDIKYLILDPHYTGSENLGLIVKQGWCGWKGNNFWNAKAYYNMCLPQRPGNVCV